MEFICIEKSQDNLEKLEHEMTSREELYKGEYEKSILQVSKRSECCKFKVKKLGCHEMKSFEVHHSYL